MGIFDIFKEVKEFGKDFDSVFNEVMHSGKEYFGDVCVQDISGNLWKIRVRHTGDRGRYLKIDSKTNSSQQIRATADDYKDYVRITPDEWEVFRLLVGNPNDKDLYYKAKSILSRIIR
ncbi:MULTISPECIES: hypothetical protein [Calothrix]|uniref:Uncharacterized protein n=2 Tax=Calothrix TaxID=1186 RepID=A0ABR8AKD9_9CYAN|nr:MULTISPECIES: hypothetical protein [Calothrix]MBD2199748.1 hypothetical protein [Calothrix parietina FACHB-288]MBD2228545.1 hypothetical protein [Calothrix anomala FACHB-343]